MPNSRLAHFTEKLKTARKREWGVRLAAPIFLITFSTLPARADLSVISESRGDSAATSGTYGAPDSASNSSMSAGAFVDGQSAATSGTSAEPIFGTTYASDSSSANASQTTFISSGTILQGAGSSQSSATIVPGGPSDSVDGNDSSTFSVTFTDSTAETLVLTGDLTGSSAYHEGTLGVIDGGVELSTGADTLYQIFNGNEANFNSPSPDSWSIPISFTTLLVPGQTYTLSLSGGTDSNVNDISLSDTSSAGFNFTASVPEPASLGIFLAGGLLLLRRRRTSS
jgi:hypothetical protein